MVEQGTASHFLNVEMSVFIPSTKFKGNKSDSDLCLILIEPYTCSHYEEKIYQVPFFHLIYSFSVFYLSVTWFMHVAGQKTSKIKWVHGYVMSFIWDSQEDNDEHPFPEHEANLKALHTLYLVWLVKVSIHSHRCVFLTLSPCSEDHQLLKHQLRLPGGSIMSNVLT